MRGNKGAFYCHLLPFITTYCHKTAKNVLVSSKNVLVSSKDVLVSSKNIAYFNDKLNIFLQRT